MKRFWDTLIEPVLEATRPKSILEIGSFEGENTKRLLAFCEERDAVLHVVDPAPLYDVAEWRERYGERFVFYEALSLEAIPRVEGFDVALIDGDHNWYTVYNELKAIEARSAELSRPFPLVMLHDILWPYARRDLYYDPETVPEAYRKPYSRNGAERGRSELVEEGGLNRQLDKAVYEGGPQNGVLTAIEDFLEETGQQLRFVKVPGFHGIGILVPPHLEESAELAGILADWDLPPAVLRHVERMEEFWLGAEVRHQNLHARMQNLRTRRQEDMEKAKARQAELRRRLAEAERRPAPAPKGGLPEDAG